MAPCAWLCRAMSGCASWSSSRNSDAPSTSRAAGLLDDWGAVSRTLVLLTEDEAAAGKSFRNIARVAVMPVTDAGVADVIGAASLLVSQAALPELVARAAGRTSDRSRVKEEAGS